MRVSWFSLVPVCALLLASCGAKKEASEEAEGAESAPVPVQVATVTRGPIGRVIRADAILYPINQANITPKISAPVRKFYVNRGDHVKAGQLLATLENRDLAAGIADTRAQLEQAQSSYRTTTAATLPEDLTKAQADVQSTSQALDAAKRVYESREQLLREGAIARKLVDDAKVVLVQAQSQAETAQRHLQSLTTVSRQEQVRGAQAQVDAAKARYQSAEAQYSYTEVRSPISGVVADRPTYEGEMAQSGTPLVSVVDVSEVIARAIVPVEQASWMRVGQTARMTAGDIELTGKVKVVSPAVNPNTTTVEVWVQAANPGERLKPGVTVRVAVHTQTVTDALIVPVAALLASDEGGQKVLVAGKDSRAYERPVEVGVRSGDSVQILKGVKEGEQVITVGGLGLEDKAKIRVQSAKEADEKDEKKDDKDEK